MFIKTIENHWDQQYLSSHFAPAFFLLSRPRREALKTIYAVFRLLDDAVDKQGGDPQPYLRAWEELFLTGNTAVLQAFGQSTVAENFWRIVQKFDIPSQIFVDFIQKGVRLDLKRVRFQTAMDLESYCYGVAGTVGLACLPIFGVPYSEAKDFAIRLGIAVQWVNTIRDIGEDAKMGRIYLPLDHLNEAGYQESALLEGVKNPSFFALVKREADQARQHFRRAAELLPLRWKKELMPARVMGAIYARLLDKMERHGFPVLEKQVRLNFLEKGVTTWHILKGASQ